MQLIEVSKYVLEENVALSSSRTVSGRYVGRKEIEVKISYESSPGQSVTSNVSC